MWCWSQEGPRGQASTFSTSRLAHRVAMLPYSLEQQSAALMLPPAALAPPMLLGNRPEIMADFVACLCPAVRISSHVLWSMRVEPSVAAMMRVVL